MHQLINKKLKTFYYNKKLKNAENILTNLRKRSYSKTIVIRMAVKTTTELSTGKAR